jgi:hypothetical protein
MDVRLIKAKTFADRYFDREDRPDERTVREWVRRGELPGKLINDRLVYVDADEWERTFGSPAVDRIIAKIEANRDTR